MVAPPREAAQRLAGNAPHSGRSTIAPRRHRCIAIVLAIWLLSGFFIVQEGQTGIILQFGRYKSMTGAGIQWRLPYPIQSNEIVNVSGVRTVEIGYSGSLRTKVPREVVDADRRREHHRRADGGAVPSEGRARVPVQQPLDPDDAVKQSAETAIREVVGRSKMDTGALRRSRAGRDPGQHSLMQQILDRYRTGILITSVTIQNAQPPEQVQAAFDDAVKAGQDRERSKNEGQAYANDVIPRAKRQRVAPVAGSRSATSSA